MALDAASRLALLTVLVATQLGVFALELLIFHPNIRPKIWYTPLRQWLAPVTLILFGLISVAVTFTTSPDHLASDPQCDFSLDADIAGIGVRIAAFMQVCVLAFVSLLGVFHCRATGVKELCAGLLYTSVSLNIALVVRMCRGSLAPADAAVGAMILDGQNMALSIQLTAKETLASRWQVHLAVLAQITGLATIAALIAGFNQGTYSSADCQCLTVFWLGWLGNCQHAVPHLEPSIFWVYLTCRSLTAAQISFHSLWNTKSFDKAEKDSRDTSDRWKKLGGPMPKITQPHFTRLGEALYGHYPATTTLFSAFSSIMAITSLCAAETTIHDHSLRPTSGVDSIGQIIALVIASQTVLRALWVLQYGGLEKLKHYRTLQSKFRGNDSCWLAAKGDLQAPESLPLGSILRDPYDLESKLKSYVAPDDAVVRRESDQGGVQDQLSQSKEQCKDTTYSIELGYSLGRASWIANATLSTSIQPNRTKKQISLEYAVGYLPYMLGTNARWVRETEGILKLEDVEWTLELIFFAFSFSHSRLDEPRHHSRSTKFDTYLRLPGFSRERAFRWLTDTSYDRKATSSFEPQPEYLDKCAALPKVKKKIGNSTKCLVAFLVTGLEIRVNPSTDRGWDSSQSSRTAMRPDSEVANARRSKSDQIGPVVYKYRVQRIELRGSGAPGL